jgi:hypothetical protein
MVYWEQWSVDPSQNNASPPAGAGENKLTFDQISDTFRVVMAAIKDVGEKGAALGTMAPQNSNAVSISGGSISSGASIDAGALKSGTVPLERLPTNLTGKKADGLTNAGLQALYNMLYPVGRIILWHSNSLTGSGLVWAGVSAVWQVVVGSGDRLIMSASGNVGPSQGAGTHTPIGQFGTSMSGLNKSQLGADTLVGISLIGSGSLQSGTDRGLQLEGGGGGVHNHVLDYNPARYGVVVIVRTS